MNNFQGIEKSEFRPLKTPDAVVGGRLDPLMFHRDGIQRRSSGGNIVKTSPSGDLAIFVPFLRKDEMRREVHGIMAEEAEDQSGTAKTARVKIDK